MTASGHIATFTFNDAGMVMEDVTVRKVRRSLQRFTDYADDLSRSDMNTFDDRLSLLMDYCQKDEVFQTIHKQLTKDHFSDFDSWYKERKSTMGSMVGSGQLVFPTNLDARLSLMYQLLCRINSGEISLIDFSHTFFAIGDSRIDSLIYAFNEAIVDPLTRELRYRFDDIEEQLPADQKDTVPLTNIQVIHSAQNVIQQSAAGSNISQSAVIEKNSELEALFEELKQEIDAAIDDHAEKSEYREVAESAHDLLCSDKPKVTAAKTLLNNLPTLGNIGSVVSAIFAAIGTFG